MAACGREGQKASEVRKFALPEVPAMIIAPVERANYLVAHYWKNFDFADTAMLHSEQFEKEIFPNYLGFLGAASLEKASGSLASLLNGMQGDTAVYNFFISNLEHYLYDPNSPMRNEDLYIPVVKQMIASPAVDPTEKMRLEDRLSLAMKNRPGDKAADFVYTTDSGRTGRLYGLKSDWLILFFNNPGCPACRDIADEMMASGVIPHLIETKKLIVLGIYPDEDLTAWFEYGASFPKEWIYARDKSQIIREKELYDLKAIPTVYLLDYQKRVVIKDAVTTQQVVQTLAEWEDFQ